MDEMTGRRAERSDAVDVAARIGMVAYGLVYLVVGWVAAQLALGQGGGRPSGQGALHELAGDPLGRILVWAVAIGLFLLVVWRLLEAGWGHREADGLERWRKRAVSLAKAAVYGALGWSAAKVAVGAGSSSSGSEQGLTARVLSWPAGSWLVGAAGLAILGYAAAQAYRGWTSKFLEDLDAQGRSGDSGTAYEVVGKVGYLAKGVAFALVGGLVVYAAVTHDPKKSGGLDEALLELLHQPFGPVLLLAIAAGLACYGLFCFARARHLDR